MNGRERMPVTASTWSEVYSKRDREQVDLDGTRCGVADEVFVIYEQ
jgi:hypothetical protein